jgi:hypothetical protein
MSSIAMTCTARRGQMTIQVLILGTVGTIVISGFALWADANIRASYRTLNKAAAFAAAEAGIEYYRWHLAHAAQDFWDGQGSTSTGPYVHNYYDKNGAAIGTFSLNITPPPAGSTVVTIASTGKVNADPTVQKVIRVKLAIPSFAKYATVANAAMRFGSGTETFGPLHSNGGIRFDGVANNIVTSALGSYDDPDHSGANEFGVHTHVPPVDPLPPTSTPSRPDVFRAGRQFPVASVDFTGITQDLAQMKSDAQANGFYVASSGARGYELILNTDDTFTVRRVTATTTRPSGCGNDPWTISSSTFVGTYPNPTSGVIFVEDHVWVKGRVNTARITIASGRFPDNSSTRTSITFTSSTLYTNYDGQDTLGFIAQNNINIALRSEDIIRVDGAMIAQNGRVGRYYYNSNCGTGYIRQQITTYGVIGTNQRYGFAYTDGTGYQIRNLIYDANLLYAPPPSFPLTTDEYSQISWEELQ